MILKNIKTGEIIVGESFLDIVKILHERKDPLVSSDFLNLNLFAEYWKEIYEYTPKKPIIKDKKVRNAVRAWAEANGIKPQDIIAFDSLEHRLVWVNTAIEFNERKALSDLDETYYSINELCGYIEEEE